MIKCLCPYCEKTLAVDPFIPLIVLLPGDPSGGGVVAPGANLRPHEGEGESARADIDDTVGICGAEEVEPAMQMAIVVERERAN